MYSSYTAASFARIYELMDQYKVNLRGVVSWSFEFEDQEWFAGFRDLATHGVDKPVLNVFRMFGMMKGTRLTVTSDHGFSASDIIANGVRKTNDVDVVASASGNSLSIMVWNYHDEDVPGQDSPVEVIVDGVTAGRILVHHYRIDKEFSNSFEKWKAMGKPQNPDEVQYQDLERAGQLELMSSPQWLDAKDGKLTLKFDLPRQGVSFLHLTW
jgi:xylan 1,4-beta-xylosidase